MTTSITRANARTRKTPKVRRAELLAAASDIARRKGLPAVTTRAVAESVGCSQPLVMPYFKPVSTLITAVIMAAIKAEDLPIIASAIAIGHTKVRSVSPELKARAIATL